MLKNTSFLALPNCNDVLKLVVTLLCKSFPNRTIQSRSSNGSCPPGTALLSEIRLSTPEEWSDHQFLWQAAKHYSTWLPLSLFQPKASLSPQGKGTRSGSAEKPKYSTTFLRQSKPGRQKHGRLTAFMLSMLSGLKLLVTISKAD